MPPSDDALLIARLARFCAALYRAVPLEGEGLVGQARELAHAADLEAEASALESGSEDEAETSGLTSRDIHVTCQLLIDVRRAPNLLRAEEVALARRHFPEVEDPSLDALEHLISFYTGLIRGEDG